MSRQVVQETREVAMPKEFNVSPQNELPVSQMTFNEIADYMGRIAGRTAAAHGGALTQRLYEIALYDNHVPKSHRDGALELLELIKGTMEIYYGNSPEALKSYREANAFMEENARQIGVGSLAWLVVEKGPMSDDELVRFVTLPEYRELLPDINLTLGPEVAKRVTEELARVRSSESPKRAASDAQFFGDFLIGQQFANIRFNIPEEKFQEFVADVPDDLRDLVTLWSMFYLLWLMRMAFRLRRGEEFEAKMMRAAYGRLMATTRKLEASSLAVPFAQAMRQWFDLFDNAADAAFALKAGKDDDFPAIEWKLASIFLLRDSSSPYYFDATKHTKDEIHSVAADTVSRMNGVDLVVAKALAKAKNAGLSFILLAPEMKRPSGE
jgi:hypothetical protein